MPKLKLPYSELEAGHCYNRLAQILPVYQKAIADIRTAMESNNFFEQRLRKVLRLHAMTLQAAETEEAESSQEEIYLCCLYDMLESLYAAEAERIALAPGTYNEKKRNLDELKFSIVRLTFGSSHYRNVVRPTLEKIVFERVKNLEGRL